MLTGSCGLVPIRSAPADCWKVSFPFVDLFSLICQVLEATRQLAPVQPGFESPAGTFHTTVSRASAREFRFPKSHVRTPAESTAPHDALTNVAVSPVVWITGGAILNVVCVKVELPSFENDAVYAMFSP